VPSSAGRVCIPYCLALGVIAELAGDEVFDAGSESGVDEAFLEGYVCGGDCSDYDVLVSEGGS